MVEGNAKGLKLCKRDEWPEEAEERLKKGDQKRRRARPLSEFMQGLKQHNDKLIAMGEPPLGEPELIACRLCTLC